MRETGVERDAKVYAWIIAVVTVLLYIGTYSCVNPVQACDPLPTCGDAGVIPGYDCATPTPTLRWDYDEGEQNDLIGYTVYWAQAGQAFDRSRSFNVDCWVYVNEETGATSRTHCYGRDLDVPIQRWVERDYQATDFAVKAMNRFMVESVSYSNVVGACMPPIWRGGPYH